MTRTLSKRLEGSVTNGGFNGAIRIGRLYSRASRPQNVLYSGFLASAVAYISGASVVRIVTCYVLIQTIYAIAASFNNIHDLKTDRANKRTDNPLVGKQTTTASLRIFMVLCSIGIIAMQFFLWQWASGVITLAFGLLLYAYSDPKLRLMSRGFMGTIALAVYYGSLPLLLGTFQTGNISNNVYFLALSQVALLLPVLLAKDYKDVHGDALTGKRTPLVVYGSKTVGLLAVGISVVVALIGAVVLVRNQALLIPSVAVSLTYCVLVADLHSKKAKVTIATRWLLSATMLSMSVLGYVTIID